ncbi:DUF2269 family protein [Streptomyces albipurpureus]|uniref:DUF2269 family protein n=1 Tax=Streptomyces albipurpureus TaxID=2897419 RepID=A0ABT0UFP8_9ACTN|nr:DUF2269 family protein [Streptomyces sp. CWNU-1]MCM2387448.1 DUF2269 family protein [Streptomyces sp. CWNU-1]
MTALLLSIHVLASIVFIGPVTVASGMFPRYARAALASSDKNEGERARAAVGLLHRISRVYAVLGLSVPVFGMATGAQMGVLSSPWLAISMILTALAAGLLAFVIIPQQKAVVDALDKEAPSLSAMTRVVARLGMTSGFFALTWAVVVVLMITRPGSTTGV